MVCNIHFIVLYSVSECGVLAVDVVRILFNRLKSSLTENTWPVLLRIDQQLRSGKISVA